MPGLFSRIFRRKQGSGGDDPKDTLVTKSGNSRASASVSSKSDRRRWNNKTSPARDAKASQTSTVSARNTDRSSPTTSEDVFTTLHLAPPPPPEPRTTTVASLSPSISPPNKFYPQTLAQGSGSWGAGPDRSDGDQRVVLGTRNYPSPKPRLAGPVDLDDTDIDTDADENILRRPGPRLSSQHLMQLEKQQPQQAKFTMQDDVPKPFFSAGNQDVMSEGDESSSFNLSTDAEDTEYENLKRHGVLRAHLDNSSLSASVKDYTTDGDNTVFPNLPTDDEGTTSGMSATYGTREQPKRDPDAWNMTSPAVPSKPALGAMTTVQQQHGEYRNYSLNQTAASASMLSSPLLSSGLVQPPREPPGGALTATTGIHVTSYSLDSNNNNNNSTVGPRREFVSPKTRDMRPKRNDNGFDNFADFSQADFGGHEWSNNVEEKFHRRVYVEADKTSPFCSQSSRQLNSASSAGGGRETSLPELLERAKSKSTKNRKSGSVNSAPAMSAAYLREHHGLSSSSSRRDGRSTEGTSSVSDIIKNLDAAAAARLHSRRSNDGVSSAHSRDNGSVRSAKERLQKHRRAREERHSRSHEESSESDENENSDSWLFDEVAGALGPKGIAADLESLSGRSRNSHTSGGGRSHKSHRSHRSHKSHRSSRRRHKASSGESVGSQSSKRSHGSRRSRGSRYSHRSTRSYISQMSEQSRSVANDLLRLEMQLAMVGNSADAGERPQPGHHRSGSRGSHRGGNAGSSSRNRPMSSQSKRSRITVLAPPGKLGIILANKADSKGTVVSGVRTSSALVEKVSPGDRIVAIDGEDVSLMTVSEITTIMARKSDFERTLTVLTSPRHMSSTQLVSSPRGSNDYRY